MRFWVVCLLLAVRFAAPAMAEEPVMPNPNYEPRQVVAIQLNALRENNLPHADAGIARVWAFAHPVNKRVTGPLARFARMIKSEAYRILLGHRHHQIKPISRTNEEAFFAVTVTGADDRVVGYRWVVRKVLSGEHSGAWMTTSVSSPIALGEET